MVWYFLIVSVLIGVSVTRHADNWEETALLVPGTVVGAEQRRGSKGGTTYAEVISFELDGVTHKFTRGSSSSGYPRIGRQRTVIVNPANPAQARVQLAPMWESLLPQVIKNNPGLGILWGVGSIFFGVGWFCFWRNHEFFRRAIIVPGTVTSFTSKRGHKGGTVYYEEVSFAFAGEQHTVSGTIGKSWKPKIGAAREVGINPDQMDEFRLREGQWFPGLFLVVGLVVLGMSLWV